MQCFDAGEVLRTLIVRFDCGDLLLEGLQEVIRSEGIETGYVTGAVGTFDRCRMHMITTTGFPSQDKVVEMEGPIELIALQGFIAGGEPQRAKRDRMDIGRMYFPEGDLGLEWAGGRSAVSA